MNTIEVALEVPEEINYGIEEGLLERVGGVIRQVDTKQIVAWLRDGNAGQVGESSPFVQLLNSPAGKQLLKNGAYTNLLLNLTIVTVGFITLNERIKHIDNEITGLKKEFERDRLVERRSALHAARDVLTAQNMAVKHKRFDSAIKGLYEAQSQLLLDVKAAPSLDEKILLLVQAMEMLTLRVHCYLHFEERDLALKELSTDLKTFEEIARSMMKECFGEHPAVFLHESLPDEAVDHFVNLQLWLRQEAYTLETYRALIQQLRPHFWDPAALSLTRGPSGIERFYHQLRGSNGPREENVLQDRLNLAEVLRENLERLQGFESEIRSLRLAISEWEAIGKQDGEYLQALLVDKSALKRLRRA